MCLPPDMCNHIAQRLQKDPTKLKRRANKRPRLSREASEELRATARAEREESKLAVTEQRLAANKCKPEIAPKQADESLREFKTRVRRETAQLLKDKATNESNTVAKRRLALSQKKKKKSLKKRGLWELEKAKVANEGMGELEDSVAFGEVAHEPPRIKAIPRKGDKGHKPWVKNPLAAPGSARWQKRQLQEVREEVAASYQELKKRRRGGGKGASGAL
ncbi:unnamed protein product [Chrysoparadoxa australica]